MVLNTPEGHWNGVSHEYSGDVSILNTRIESSLSTFENQSVTLLYALLACFLASKMRDFLLHPGDFDPRPLAQGVCRNRRIDIKWLKWLGI